MVSEESLFGSDEKAFLKVSEQPLFNRFSGGQEKSSSFRFPKNRFSWANVKAIFLFSEKSPFHGAWIKPFFRLRIKCFYGAPRKRVSFRFPKHRCFRTPRKDDFFGFQNFFGCMENDFFGFRKIVFFMPIWKSNLSKTENIFFRGWKNISKTEKIAYSRRFEMRLLFLGSLKKWFFGNRKIDFSWFSEKAIFRNKKSIFHGPWKSDFSKTEKNYFFMSQKSDFPKTKKSLFRGTPKNRFFWKLKKSFFVVSWKGEKTFFSVFKESILFGATKKRIFRYPKNHFFSASWKSDFSVSEESLLGGDEKVIFSVSEKSLFQGAKKMRFFFSDFTLFCDTTKWFFFRFLGNRFLLWHEKRDC